MIKNALKTAWRQIGFNKSYSFINIFGLTIGLCSCMLVATVIIDDLSYDTQWSNSKNLYRIISKMQMGDGLYTQSASSFTGLQGALKSNFPEVEEVVPLTSYKYRMKLSDKEPNGVDVTVLRTDEKIWKALDLEITAGNPKNFIEGDNFNLVISENFRKKFFPNEDPIGKIIYSVPTFGEKGEPNVITGVIKDIPSNSVFRSDVMLLFKASNDELYKAQHGTFSEQYVVLKPGVDVSSFTRKMNKWYSDFVAAKDPVLYEFQPLQDVYLHSDFSSYQYIKGNIKTIYIFIAIALLLLFIACINYVNLSTSKAIERIKETSVRKILGASKGLLMYQFLFESLMYFLTSAGLAMILYAIFLPILKTFIGHDLHQTFVTGWHLPASFAVLIIILSILTGLYPALVLSAPKTSGALKGEIFQKSRGGQNTVRKGLVVLQFAISIFVLAGLFVVQKQLLFLQNKDLGYEPKGLLSIGHISWDGKGAAFKNEILKMPQIESVAISDWLPTSGPGSMAKFVSDPINPQNKIEVNFISGDIDLPKTLGLKLTRGRFFNNSYGFDKLGFMELESMEDSTERVNAANRQSSLITNFTAKKLLVKNLNQPIPKVQTTPVGLVQDFNNESLRETMKPTVIIAEESPAFGGMLLRVKPGREKEAMAAVDEKWRQFFPQKFLNMNRVEDLLSQQYKEEANMQKVFTFFSSLSMFLAALGILGLVILATAQRKKEIGVRKVLGASVASIMALFSKDFLKLVLIGLIIATPIAWYFADKWLADFPYRITVSWWVFAVSGIIAALVALITISFQTAKSAMANPVESLRTE